MKMLFNKFDSTYVVFIKLFLCCCVFVFFTLIGLTYIPSAFTVIIVFIITMLFAYWVLGVSNE